MLATTRPLHPLVHADSPQAPQTGEGLGTPHPSAPWRPWSSICSVDNTYAHRIDSALTRVITSTGFCLGLEIKIQIWGEKVETCRNYLAQFFTATSKAKRRPQDTPQLQSWLIISSPLCASIMSRTWHCLHLVTQERPRFFGGSLGPQEPILIPTSFSEFHPRAFHVPFFQFSFRLVGPSRRCWFSESFHF